MESETENAGPSLASEEVPLTIPKMVVRKQNTGRQIIESLLD
jgi:hypothetical protein